jgi:PhnB protein
MSARRSVPSNRKKSKSQAASGGKTKARKPAIARKPTRSGPPGKSGKSGKSGPTVKSGQSGQSGQSGKTGKTGTSAAARRKAPTGKPAAKSARGAKTPGKLPRGPRSERNKAGSRAAKKPARAAAATPTLMTASGHTAITPYLVVEGAARAIEFYRQVFGAALRRRLAMPGDERLMHAEIEIGGALLMMSDDFPEMQNGVSRSPLRLGGSPVTVHLFVPDVDAVFERAVGAGCQVLMPLADMFWGDRFGCVIDPFGHVWSLATHLEDVSPEELEARVDAMAAQCAAGADPSETNVTRSEGDVAEPEIASF